MIKPHAHNSKGKKKEKKKRKIGIGGQTNIQVQMPISLCCLVHTSRALPIVFICLYSS